MGPISLWVSAAGVPIGLWFISVAIRLGARRELTSGADWVLLLLVFDVTAALSLEDFQRFVQFEPFRKEFSAVLAILGLCGGFAWVIIALYLEPWLAIGRNPKATPRSFTRMPAPWLKKASAFFSVLVIIFITTAGHVLAFTWKGWTPTP